MVYQPLASEGFGFNTDKANQSGSNQACLVWWLSRPQILKSSCNAPAVVYKSECHFLYYPCPSHVYLKYYNVLLLKTRSCLWFNKSVLKHFQSCALVIPVQFFWGDVCSLCFCIDTDTRQCLMEWWWWENWNFSVIVGFLRASTHPPRLKVLWKCSKLK